MIDFIINFPCFAIVLSLLCAVASSVISGKAARKVSVCLICVVMVMSAAVLWRGLVTGEVVTYQMGHRSAPWGNELRFGIVEPLLVLVFGAVLLLSITGGQKYLDLKTERSKQNLYFAMVDLVQASLMVFAYTNDIFTGYVFVEICTIASCGILVIRESGRAIAAAVRYMIFSLLGSGLFLLGVILLYNVTGHLLMPDIRETVSELWTSGQYHVPLAVIISLMVCGLAIKSGMFPFYFWMPDTYGTAIPGSSSILSGLISKGYIVLLVKVIFSVVGTDVFYVSGAQNVLFVFGVVGMIVGSISAIRENNINRMLAYSSASQIGYIYMGIGISPTAGMCAAVFHILTHALTKPTLFLSAARLTDVSGGHKVFQYLQGAGMRDKVAGIAFTVGAMSMVGVPLFIGFISKLLFATAGVQAEWKLLPTLIALALSTVLNTMYFMRTVLRIYTPAEPETAKTFKCVGWRAEPKFIFASVCFVAIIVGLGIHAQPVVSLIEEGLRLL